MNLVLPFSEYSAWINIFRLCSFSFKEPLNSHQKYQLMWLKPNLNNVLLRQIKNHVLDLAQKQV